MDATPTQGDLLMAAKARQQARAGAGRVSSVQWDENELQRQRAEAAIANRQRIDEPKTRRWSSDNAAIAEGVTLQAAVLKKLRTLFDMLDSDGNGEISKEEALKFWEGNFSHLNAASMFESVDADCNGNISWDEYLTFWKAVVGRGYSEEELTHEIDTMQAGRSWVGFNQDRLKYTLASNDLSHASSTVLSRAAFPGYSEALRRFHVSYSARSNPSTAERNPFESRLFR